MHEVKIQKVSLNRIRDQKKKISSPCMWSLLSQASYPCKLEDPWLSALHLTENVNAAQSMGAANQVSISSHVHHLPGSSVQKTSV